MSDDPIRRAQELMRVELPKKFYTEASLAREGDGFAVKLDGRPVKTPSRKALVLPTEAAGEHVRAEWQAQENVIDPAKMPITRLVNTIIDGVFINADAVFEEVMAYAGTDMLFYRAESPVELVERQSERWDPVLDWFAEHYGARFVLVEGVMFADQPRESLDAFRNALEKRRDPFELGALHVMTTLTGSALITLALADGHLSLDEAWSLSNLEEDWTVELWGHDEEAARRRAKRFEDMAAAHTLYLSLKS